MIAQRALGAADARPRRPCAAPCVLALAASRSAAWRDAVPARPRSGRARRRAGPGRVRLRTGCGTRSTACPVSSSRRTSLTRRLSRTRLVAALAGQGAWRVGGAVAHLLAGDPVPAGAAQVVQVGVGGEPAVDDGDDPAEPPARAARLSPPAGRCCRWCCRASTNTAPGSPPGSRRGRSRSGAGPGGESFDLP